MRSPSCGYPDPMARGDVLPIGRTAAFSRGCRRGAAEQRLGAFGGRQRGLRVLAGPAGAVASGSGSGVWVPSGLASAPRSRSTRSVHEMTGAKEEGIAEPEAGDEANGGRAGGGAWAGGSEPEALPAMSGRGG